MFTHLFDYVNYLSKLITCMCNFQLSKQLKHMYNFKQFHTGLISLTMVRRGNGWHCLPEEVSTQVGIVDNPIIGVGIKTVHTTISENALDVGTMGDVKLNFKPCVKHQVYSILNVFQNCFAHNKKSSLLRALRYIYTVREFSLPTFASA